MDDTYQTERFEIRLRTGMGYSAQGEGFKPLEPCCSRLAPVKVPRTLFCSGH
jgi:hypothetical protein